MYHYINGVFPFSITIVFQSGLLEGHEARNGTKNRMRTDPGISSGMCPQLPRVIREKEADAVWTGPVSEPV